MWGRAGRSCWNSFWPCLDGMSPGTRDALVSTAPETDEVVRAEIDIAENGAECADFQCLVSMNRNRCSQLFSRHDVVTAPNPGDRKALGLEQSNHFRSRWAWQFRHALDLPTPDQFGEANLADSGGLLRRLYRTPRCRQRAPPVGQRWPLPPLLLLRRRGCRELEP